MRRAAWASLLMIGSVVAADPSAARGVRLVTGLEYSQFADPGAPNGGMPAELVLAAFEAAGVAVEQIEFMPWKRGYEEVLNRKFDATFPYIRAPGRDQLMLYSAPIYEIAVWPAFRADRVRSYVGPEGLAGLTLCEPLGWAPPTELLPLIDAGKVSLVEASSLQLCTRQLLAARVDMLITSSALFERVVRPEWHDGLPPALGDHPIANDRQYLLMARSNPAAPEMLARFAAGLEILRTEGRYDAILCRDHGASP